MVGARPRVGGAACGEVVAVGAVGGGVVSVLAVFYTFDCREDQDRVTENGDV
jgi:hypothetical protein